jgi:AcrR family transcriptional regulator
LAAAQRLFAERGFEGASTKAIAAAAGVPSGLVFYYFPTKEHLIDGVFEHNAATDMMYVFHSAEGATSQHEALSIVLLGLLRWLAAHRDQAYILIGEIASKRPIAKRLREIRSAALDSLARFLTERSMIDTRAGVDAYVVAQSLSAALIFATVLDHPTDEVEYVNRLASMVVRGKGAPAKSSKLR